MYASTAERNWLCRCFQFDTEWSSSTLWGRLLCICALHLCLFVYFVRKCAWPCTCLCVRKIKRASVCVCAYVFICECLCMTECISVCMHESLWSCVFIEKHNYPEMRLSFFFPFSFFGSQLWYSLSSDDLLLLPWSHLFPILADTSLKSKRQHNTVIVTSLFLFVTTNNALIQMLGCCFAVKFISNSEPIDYIATPALVGWAEH